MPSDLAAAFDAVRAAIAAAGTELDPAVAAAARRDLDDAEQRHLTTGNHTVAALVGGTGSGKSTLFNAVTRTSFADPSEVRPSTRQTSAFVWGRRADSLLDHLGVHPARRMFLDTVLERERQRALDGLVLLDLPDHDSVEEHHSEQVDRLLPVVDVLIWVVDPQKYADHILHEVYLRGLRTRADAMVMVLNHADTLDVDGRETVVADIRRLLAADGLGEVPVLQTCALTGEGVSEVRDVLRAAVAEESTADRTAAAAVDAVARGLLERIGPPAAPLESGELDHTVAELMRASGIPAVTESIAHAVARWGGGALAEPQHPSRAAVAAIGSFWAGRAKANLPASWSRAVDGALPSVETLLARTAEAVRSVPLPPVKVPSADRSGWAGVVALVLALVAVVAGAMSRWPAPWVAVTAVVLTVLGVVLLRAARKSRAGVARERAATWEREVREALTATAAEVLAEPTRSILDRHSAVRRALTDALVPSTIGRPGAGSPA